MTASGLSVERLRLRAGPGEVSFSAPPGSLLGVLGPQGAGKSALIGMLCGEAAVPASGRVMLDGADLRGVPMHRRGFGLVAQEDALFPGRTLAENVAYPLARRGVAARARRPMVEAALDSVSLGGRGGVLAARASAAERQLAAIARATVFGPRVLLLDEPLSAQDAADRPMLVAALRRLHAVIGCITILGTRVAADALALCDRMVVLQGGRVVQAGAPAQIYDQPNSAEAALASGEANLLPGVVHAVDEDEGLARVGLACGPVVEGYAGEGLRPRDPCLFCLRPERIAVVPASASDFVDGALDAVVLEALPLGDVGRLRLLLGAGQEVVVKRPAAAGLRGLRPGEGVAIAWQPQHAVAFKSMAGTPNGR